MCGHCGCGSEAKTTALDLQTGEEIAMEPRAHDHDHHHAHEHEHEHSTGMSIYTPTGPDILIRVAPMMRLARTY